MPPEILIAVLAAVAVLPITFGVAARPSEDAVQALGFGGGDGEDHRCEEIIVIPVKTGIQASHWRAP